MRRVAFLLACLAVSGAVGGCELLVGIKDKTTGDGGAAGDDAGAGGDAGQDPSAPCNQQPPGVYFCDDFDSELEAGDTWLWDTPMDGGAVEWTMNSKTSPRAVQFTVPSAPASGQLGLQITPSPTRGYRIAFDMFIETGDLSSIPQVGVAQGLRTPAPTDPLEVDYVVGPGKVCELRVSDGASNPVVTLPLPPTQRWTRIVLAYDATQGVTVLEDGATIGTSAEAAHGPPGSTEVILGAVYSNVFGGGSTTPFVVDIDDVVVRVE